MKIIPFAVALALASTLSTAPAMALNARSFVSAHGLDTNACTLAAPCRTLQHAHDQTNAGGEIDVLDPAGYGAIVITKSISIVNDGVGTVGVLQPIAGEDAIVIQASASDTVYLRGLNVDGLGVARHGIRLFDGAGSVTIIDCVVRHFYYYGIAFAPTNAVAVKIDRTVSSDNGYGIYVGQSSAKVTLTNVSADHNANHGLYYDNGFGSFVAASNSSFSSNAVYGVFIDHFSNDTSIVASLDNNTISNNVTAGVFEQRSGVYITRNFITGNATGLGANSGIVYTNSDNHIGGNGLDVNSSLTSLALK